MRWLLLWWIGLVSLCDANILLRCSLGFPKEGGKTMHESDHFYQINMDFLQGVFSQFISGNTSSLLQEVQAALGGKLDMELPSRDHPADNHLRQSPEGLGHSGMPGAFWRSRLRSSGSSSTVEGPQRDPRQDRSDSGQEDGNELTISTKQLSTVRNSSSLRSSQPSGTSGSSVSASLAGVSATGTVSRRNEASSTSGPPIVGFTYINGRNGTRIPYYYNRNRASGAAASTSTSTAAPPRLTSPRVPAISNRFEIPRATTPRNYTHQYVYRFNSTEERECKLCLSMGRIGMIVPRNESIRASYFKCALQEELRSIWHIPFIYGYIFHVNECIVPRPLYYMRVSDHRYLNPNSLMRVEGLLNRLMPVPLPDDFIHPTWPVLERLWKNGWEHHEKSKAGQESTSRE